MEIIITANIFLPGAAVRGCNTQWKVPLTRQL